MSLAVLLMFLHRIKVCEKICSVIKTVYFNGRSQRRKLKNKSQTITIIQGSSALDFLPQKCYVQNYSLTYVTL